MSENVPRYTANKKAMARMYLVGRVSLGQTCPQIQKHRLPCYMYKVWIVLNEECRCDCERYCLFVVKALPISDYLQDQTSSINPTAFIRMRTMRTLIS